MDSIKVIVGLTTNMIPDVCKLVAEYYSKDLVRLQESRFEAHSYYVSGSCGCCGICLATVRPDRVEKCNMCFLNVCIDCVDYLRCEVCDSYICNYCSTYRDENGCVLCDTIYEKMKCENKISVGTFLHNYVSAYLKYCDDCDEGTENTPIQKYMEIFDPNIEYKKLIT